MRWKGLMLGLTCARSVTSCSMRSAACAIVWCGAAPMFPVTLRTTATLGFAWSISAISLPSIVCAGAAAAGAVAAVAAAAAIPPLVRACALFFFSSFSGTHRRKRFVRSANTNTNTTRKRPVMIGLLCVRRWCIPHHCFFFALRLWCDSGAAASGMTISYFVRPLFASRLLPPSLPLLLCRLQPMRMRWLHTRSA